MCPLFLKELAGNEIALKKLNARSKQLPLALEAAKMEEDLRRSIEDDLNQELEESAENLR